MVNPNKSGTEAARWVCLKIGYCKSDGLSSMSLSNGHKIAIQPNTPCDKPRTDNAELCGAVSEVVPGRQRDFQSCPLVESLRCGDRLGHHGIESVDFRDSGCSHGKHPTVSSIFNLSTNPLTAWCFCATLPGEITIF